MRGEVSDWKSTDEMDDEADAALFDTPPGLGFNSDTVAAGIVPLPGGIRGGGSTFAVSPSQNNAFKAVNRAWEAGASVRFESGAPQTGDPDSGGRFIIGGLSGAVARSLVEDLNLRAEGTGTRGLPVRRARVGLFRPWQASMDEGWTRWLMERYGFDVVSVRNADVKAGGSEGSIRRHHPGGLRSPDHPERSRRGIHPSPVCRWNRGRRGAGPG